MMSTYSRMVMSSPTAARSGVATSCTADCGSPAAFNPACTHLAITPFEASASEPPRRMQALPDLRQRAAASAVTFGRDS